MNDNAKKIIEDAKNHVESDLGTLKAVHDMKKVLHEELREDVKSKIEGYSDSVKEKLESDMGTAKAVHDMTRVLRDDRRENHKEKLGQVVEKIKEDLKK